MIGRYVTLFHNGELKKRAHVLMQKLSSCTLCPRVCRVNRLKNEKGFCKTGRHATVSSYCVHHGEEPPISGTHGSGTIFFSFCNLSCSFCQNYQISHAGEGKKTDAAALASMMLSLQESGCHNVNLVSPTHVIPQILEALVLAAQQGLHIPLVYNSNGYDSIEVLKDIKGIIDVYMPDCKYSSNENAEKYSHAPLYWKTVQAVIREMAKQVGALECDEAGVTIRGLLVRHLIMPYDIAGSYAVLKFLARDISPHVSISLMAQYHPCFEAEEFPALARKIDHQEYQQVIKWAQEFDLEHLFLQELSSSDIFLPNFGKPNPFPAL